MFRSLPAALAVVAVGLFTRAPIHASASIADTRAALQDNEFIAYSPGNGWSPGQTVSVPRLTYELMLLRATGRTGVITYTMRYGLDKVPEVAKSLGFRYVIVGLENPATDFSYITASNEDFIDGIMVGNEGICRGLGACGSGTPNWTTAQLVDWIADAREEWPDKLVVTSEVWLLYDQAGPFFQPELLTLESGDVVFPSLHPLWDPTPQVAYCPQVGVEFVQNVIEDLLLPGNPEMPIVLHESWWPSEPAGNTCNNVQGCSGTPNGYSEAAQKRFFTLLAASGVSFVWGEAFDQPWKNETTNTCGAALGPHWGLWKNDGTPKQVVDGALDATLFRDDFESGNTSAWQFTQP